MAGDGFAMSTGPALSVKDLRVVFPHAGHALAALDGVDLEVPSGQFLVITGPSGQGKSTLLKAIAGLLEPTSGEIRTNGSPVTGPSPERGMVFQQDTVFPWMRVEDNISYGLRAKREATREERSETVERYLRAVGLERFRDSWPKQLSGGMRKRVAVAAAFASDPKILLMDEPFGSLDFLTRLNLHQTLLELWQATDKTILFVTHDVDEALVLADRVVVITDGRVVDDLPISFDRPRDDALRAEPEAIQIRRRLLEGLGVATAAEEMTER
jgi:ABC-type nitrate/sulfonate/bicarbonate transport system ATPase subunit